jgi:hypothetical protein
MTQDKASTQDKGTKKLRWDIKKTPIILNMHTNIWKDRNTYVHGVTTEEAREKACEALYHIT